MPMKKYLRSILGMALTILLGVMLFMTIYFTLFDLQWIAFLSGVLFAAVSATASQASKAQWLVARRNRQLQKVKDALIEEVAQRKRAVGTQKLAEDSLQLIIDTLPVMIAFIDRNERCCYHNPSFSQWSAHSANEISGQPMLHDLVGSENYQELKSHSADVFAGKEVRYAAGWRRADGARENCNVTLLPFPPHAEQPTGYYVLVANNPAAQEAAPLTAPDIDDTLSRPHRKSGPLHLQSMAERLTGGKDPRAHLVRALQEDQFILFAQRIQPLSRDAHQKPFLEILLRLQEEEQQMLPPGGFFAVAERYDLMGEIDRWVVRNVLAWCARKKRDDRGWRMPLCCINLSSATLSDAAFPHYVRNELKRNNIAGSNLCFEIHELDLIKQQREIHALMAPLKPLGCCFTADGFGSMNTSFTQFQDLKFDFLKLDGSIVQNIVGEQSDLAEASDIVRACRKTGIRTIAGFVETNETLAKLKELGIDHAQGFGIDRPKPLAQFHNPPLELRHILNGGVQQPMHAAINAAS